MDKYIGFKMIEAEPMTEAEFLFFKNKISEKQASEMEGKLGYKVVYEGGYESWSPKIPFDNAHMKVSGNNTITQENVDDFIVDYEVFTKKDKITIVIATLRNNFTIVESSACVDSANYNEKIGEEICKEKIKNQVWMLLGFLLQTAKDGIK